MGLAFVAESGAARNANRASWPHLNPRMAVDSKKMAAAITLLKPRLIAVCRPSMTCAAAADEGLRRLAVVASSTMSTLNATAAASAWIATGASSSNRMATILSPRVQSSAMTLMNPAGFAPACLTPR
jgi:hypothetical protein